MKEKASVNFMHLLKRFFAVLLCVLLLLPVMTAFAVNGADTYPTMFVNDMPWYGESEYPFHIIFRTLYVPISIFERIAGVNVKKGDRFVNVIISYKNRYMSFDAESGNVSVSDGTSYRLESYLLYGGECYIPLTSVCDFFAFSYEVLGENYIRICDGSQRLAFTALLSIYSPNYRDYIKQPQTPVLDFERSVYLTFEGDPSLSDSETADLLSSICNLLSENNMSATFFLTGNQIRSSVREIFGLKAIGCEIGLHTMTHNESYFARDIENFINELEEENDLLYQLLNFRTRIARAPEGSHTRRFVISPSEYEQIKRAGYVIWDYNCDLYGVNGTKALADAAISKIKSSEISILRLALNENSLKALPLLLDYLKQTKKCSVKTILPSLSEMNLIT